MVIHLIANAHLDPIWLWNWQAGVDEALSTFRSAVDRCHEYPELTYTRGEAWLYEWVEDLDPGLMKEVEALVRDGRWSIAGGQYVQPDANLPTWAGWKKQFELGQRYFKERFGVVPTVGYNVDTFGHPATLPKILKEAGCRGYVFHRPNEKQVELPAQTFRWRGSEGTEVLGFRIAAAYVTRADELHGQIDMTLQAADPSFGHTMMFYGLGNHGGGPTKATIEWLLEHRASYAERGIELRFSTVEDFFDQAESYHAALPVVDYELQNTFPGCYSVMHDIKQVQHKGERLLEQAEELARAFSLCPKQQELSIARLNSAWKDLAFTEFHDILAGTSVPSSFLSTRHLQGRASIIAEEEIVRISRRYARQSVVRVNEQRLVLLNASDHAFEGYVECEPFIDFDDWSERWFADEKGEAVPFQLIEPEANMGSMCYRVVLPVEIPAQGCRLYELRQHSKPSSPPPALPAQGRVEEEGRTAELSTGALQLSLGQSGIASLRHEGSELFGPGGLQFHLREDHGDTWVFQQTAFEEEIHAVLAELRWTSEESGPLRARCFATGRLGHSAIKLAVTVLAGRPEVQIDLRVNFQEGHKILQMPIELASPPTSWNSGLAGGSVPRQPGVTERPFCGWDSVAGESGSLSLTTTDSYSSRLNGSIWQHSLLRSPLAAWAGQPGLKHGFVRQHTDQGEHSFQFILRVDESFSEEKAHQRSDHHAKRPVIFDHYEGMNRPAWGNAPPRRLWTPDIAHARTLGHMKHLDAADQGLKNWEE